MKQSNDFAFDMLDLDANPGKRLNFAARDARVSSGNGEIYLDIPFSPCRHEGVFKLSDEAPSIRRFTLRSYGPSVLRLFARFGAADIEESSVMLDESSPLARTPLSLRSDGKGIFEAFDAAGNRRMRLSTVPHELRFWSDLQPPAYPMVQLTLYPDGTVPVEFMSYDQFFPGKFESVSLGYTSTAGAVGETLFSLHAGANERFYGTGERFAALNLSGRTVTLENTDSMGTDSRKAYKNIPFYVSSAGYGLFIHSSNHIRLSFADISIRAVQGLIEDDRLDLFFIGGGVPERVIYNYRTLTGFSPELPLWSYGMWMSRMTYVSAAEVEGITKRLRDEDYPCDVIHLDTGYFETDWVCEWSFSKERFPEPARFMKRLRDDGFYVSVWQTPNIGKGNKLYDEAVANAYIPTKKSGAGLKSLSDFSGQDFGGQIDFSSPKAVAWYKGLVRRLLDLGVLCIKTDFGEKIDMTVEYETMDAQTLQNRYALLYQKAAFEATSEYSDHPFIWGRSSWAGGQRYPLHWGGDTASSWDGLAASLRGGLEFGLSGFTYWSHDIPGFHTLPDFMNSPLSDVVYVRWTQFGVFSSHMRYHGSCPREPWEVPRVAPIVRKWLRLRYALIPYIAREGAECGRTGRAMISPLFIDYPSDGTAWAIEDQYLFGRDMLVAPVMNDEGRRDVYLPGGEWVDFFGGRKISGGRWVGERTYPLEEMPVFVKFGAEISVYPERVSCTDKMDLSKVVTVKFDDSYRGISAGIFGELLS